MSAESTVAVEVMEKIGDQIGIAYDNASSWLANALPQFAQMEAFRHLVPGIIEAVIAALLLVGAIAAVVLIVRDVKENGFYSDAAINCFLVFILVVVMLGFVGLATGHFVNFYCWTNTPDGMFLKMLINAAS